MKFSLQQKQMKTQGNPIMGKWKGKHRIISIQNQAVKAKIHIEHDIKEKSRNFIEQQQNQIRANPKIYPNYTQQSNNITKNKFRIREGEEG